MPSNMSPEKMIKAENQALDIAQRIWNQTDRKKNLARIITFVTIAYAVYQELFLETHLSNNWFEITLYLIMGYFGMASYRSVFKIRK